MPWRVDSSIDRKWEERTVDFLFAGIVIVFFALSVAAIAALERL
jgi:hypothetical protein